MTRITIDRRGATAPTQDLLVDGQLLTRQEIAAEVANFPAATPAESWQAAERALTLRLALRARASRLGVVATPQADPDGRLETDEDAMLRALLAREVTVPAPDEAEIAAWYHAHPSHFRTPDLFEASHILFAADPGEAEQRAQAWRRAGETAELLAADPARFAAIAAEVSACGSARQGGSLGQISGGETAPAFDAALHALAPGEISAPVETRFGVHLIALARREPGQQLPLTTVRDAIAARLMARAGHRATADYLARVMAEAAIGPAPDSVEPAATAALRSFVTGAGDDAWLQLIGTINRSPGTGVAPIIPSPG